MSDKEQLAVWFRYAVLLTIGLYAFGLAGPLMFDDGPNLQPVRDWLDGRLRWYEVMFGNSSGQLGRPVSMASFLLTAGLGKYNAFSFKLGNLVLHVACGVAIWAFLRNALVYDRRLAPRAELIAAVVASMWLLHPLHVSTVLNAVQRMAQLSTFFVVLTMLVYVKARQRMASDPPRSARVQLFLLLPLLMLLGAFSKENAIVAPAMCLALELGWLRSAGAKTPRDVVIFFALFLALPFVLGTALLIKSPGMILDGYAVRDFTLGERLLTQPRVLIDYLYQLLLPQPWRMGPYTDDFSWSTGLLAPATTLLAIGALAAASIGAWLLRRRLPFVLVGWLIFLIGHSVESSVFGLELYFEHRNYLPSVGVVLIAVGLFYLAVERWQATPAARLEAVLPLAVIALLAVGTGFQVVAWRSKDAISAQGVRSHPDSMRANLDRVTLALNSGFNEQGVEIARRLQASNRPRNRVAGHITQATLDCLRIRSSDPANLEAAVASLPPRITLGEVQALATLARANNEFGCGNVGDPEIARAIARMLEKSSAQPDSANPRWRANYLAATIFLRANLLDEAMTHALHAWQPQADAGVGSVLFQLHMRNKQFEQAHSILSEMSARIGRHDSSGKASIARLRASIPVPPAAGR
jgi:protein O-mannosyl-transferase